MSLDALFGAGTAAAFAEKVDISALFPGVRATTFEWTNPDGTAGTETKWAAPDGALAALYRLHYAPPTVHCVVLAVEPDFRGKGLLTHLCGSLNHWWPTLGLTRNTMTTRPGDGERMLMLAGFGPQPDGWWGCPLPSPRLEEAARKEGSWRDALPPPREEPF